MTQILLFLINRSFSEKRKETLYHDLEMLAHIQRQSDLPPMPSINVLSRIAMTLVLSLGVIGILINIVAVLATIIWIITAALTDIAYYVTNKTGVIATIYAGVVIWLAIFIMKRITVRTFQKKYISWRYPCRIISLFDRLQGDSFLISGQIDNVKYENHIFHIDYSFYLREADKTIRGCYLTRLEYSFVPGDTIIVRYIDDTIHAPIFRQAKRQLS